MESPIRFALVGCGRVAGNHLDAIARLPRATIAAVCDLDAARARRYNDTFGVRWYTNYHEMLTAEQIDVVSIVTPSGMNARHAVDVMEQHRKHVVIEKPMALRLTDVDATLTCDRDSQGDVWFADMGLSVVRPHCLQHLEDGVLPQKWMGRRIYPIKQWGGLDVDYEWQIPLVEHWLRAHGVEPAGESSDDWSRA
jgi:hypothetical protein